MIDPIVIYIARILLVLYYVIVAIGGVAIHGKQQDGKHDGVSIISFSMLLATLWYIATR